MLLVGLLATTPASAQVAVGNLQNQAVEWLQDYIRINTINPPGNEIAGAKFFAAIFEAEGIPYEMVESAPGRVCSRTIRHRAVVRAKFWGASGKRCCRASTQISAIAECSFMSRPRTVVETIRT